jgi:hypothetical protein
MFKKLCNSLMVLVLAMSFTLPSVAAQDQQSSNPFDMNAWMGMFNPTTTTAQEGVKFNFAHPNGWAMFMNPSTYPQLMNPATYGQFMTPQFYMQFADPNNWMAWTNPSAYVSFMNPGTYMQWMNPAAYMQFMNPAIYMQPMNPANYGVFMNPATYMQWMNPAAYTMPGGHGQMNTTNSGAFNFFDPMMWMNMAQMPAQQTPEAD